ncbi:MAG: tRNA pseudouridine(55) synthase TruB [Thermoanaerobaculia bacterium]|nr:tRNA pseudouridine(55) synthase TruB [Thermoanaerobaculia bacterium]
MGRKRNQGPQRHGLLLVDKHEGCTSHDIVAQARRILRQKKIGHCGTLDPAATGLLLLTVGNATRLTRFLIRAPKIYEGSARLGVVTDTYDITGEVTAEQPVDGVTRDAIDETMASFLGVQEHRPPAYSAKKVGGKKLYELARAGEEVEVESKEVMIYDFRATGEWCEGEDLDFLLSCSSGTYARSMVYELGRALGTGATLSALRRTQIGSFQLDDATTIRQLKTRMDGCVEAGDEPHLADLGEAWIPFDDITLPFGGVQVDAQQEKRIRHGQTVLVRDLDSQEGDWIKIANQRREFIAVGSVVERIGTGKVGVIQPKVVFRAAD